MEKVLNLVQMYDNLPNNPLVKTDKFSMPVLDFDYTRSYEELLNIRFTNQNLDKYKI